ncbi:MAG: hypothetical protein L0271_21280, partial [Gemmatimonadetes bacterium]|nr:hypothetical protein [Gemmatimonadota bacterium]
MVTGSRSFPGKSSADVLGGITSGEPDWTLLPPETPRRVREVLRRCLTKDQARRLHDIADARIEIEDAISDPLAVERMDAPAVHRSFQFPPWILASVLVVLAAAAVRYAVTAPAPDTRSPARVSIALPPDVSLFAIGRGSSVAVSPDGRRIVYAAMAGGRRQLYMRLLDGVDSAPIAGTENAANPFFSPDGRWVGFTASPDGGSLKRVPVEGGAALTVVDSLGDGLRGFAVQGPMWAPDDTIVFGAVNPRSHGLWRVAASGGSPARVTTPRDGDWLHTWAQILPTGTAVLYTIWNNTGFDGARIAVQPLAGGESTTLVEGASYGRVISSDGRRAWLVYARPEGLLAAPFDLERLRVSGRSVPVLNGVLVNMSGASHFAVSDNGLL